MALWMASRDGPDDGDAQRQAVIGGGPAINHLTVIAPAPMHPCGADATNGVSRTDGVSEAAFAGWPKLGGRSLQIALTSLQCRPGRHRRCNCRRCGESI